METTITVTAVLLVMLFGLWLIAVSVLMAVRPRIAIAGVGKAASTAFINYGEQVLRLIAGVALIIAADVSLFPFVFSLAGWFIAVSAVVIMVLPRRWHRWYAVWWAQRLNVTLVRIASPIALLGGLFLIYAVLPLSRSLGST